MSNFALRFKDSDKTNCFMQFINSAKSNPYILYDSTRRNSLFIKVRKFNYDISLIKEQCYTDSIALLCLACMKCGIPEHYFFAEGKCCDEENVIGVLLNTKEFDIVCSDYVIGDIFSNGEVVKIIE